MPQVVRGTVLVTCAASFAGEHMVRALLAAEYAVRGSVNSGCEATHLRSVFGGEVDVVVVGGNVGLGAAWRRARARGIGGAYACAVAGVDAVIYTGGPCDTRADDFAEGSYALARPAKNALRSLLSACAATSTVKRVILLSSVAAVGGGASCCTTTGVTAPPLSPGECLDEESWNDRAVALCDTHGTHAPPDIKCAGTPRAPLVLTPARRTLVERAFWKYLDTDPRGVAFDGVAIVAAPLLGPPAGYPSSAEGPNAVLGPWLRAPLGEEKLERVYWPHADVRDGKSYCGPALTPVAHAASRALSSPVAGGQRFIVCAGATFGNDIALAAQRVGNPLLTLGNPDPCFRAQLARDAGSFSSAKARRVLGVHPRCIDDTLADAVDGIQPFMCAVNPERA